MVRYLCRWSVPAVLALSTTVAQAAPFYRETFPGCVEATGTQAAVMAGWKALKSSRPLGQPGYLKVFPPGSTDPVDAFNSFPSGAQQGQAFWSKPTTGLTIFTDEYSFGVAVLRNLTFSHRLDSLTDPMQLAFLIDSQWYIAEQGVYQAKLKIWETRELDPRAFTYSVSPLNPGSGPEVGSLTRQSLPLTGTIRAFGIFMPNVTERVRLDNFTLNDWNASTTVPVSRPDQARCADLPPIGTAPVGTPAPGTVDPEEPVVPVIKYYFCGRARGRGTSLSLTRLQRSALIRSLSRETVVNLRDKALISLMLSVRGLRTNTLNDLRVVQYYSVGGTSYLSLSDGRRPLKVRGQLKRVLDRYISVAKLEFAPDGPLFRVIRRTELTSNSLCQGDMERMLRRRLLKIRR